MKREITLTTLFMQSKRHWKKIVLTLLIFSCLGAFIGFLPKKVNQSKLLSNEGNENQGEHIEVENEKTNLENNITLFTTKADQIENYLMKSILVSYDPLSLPTTILTALLSVDNPEEELILTTKYENAYKQEDYYNGMRQIIGEYHDDQYLDELTSASYDPEKKKMVFSIIYDDFEKGEKLVHHLYNFVKENMETNSEIKHTLINLGTYSSRMINKTLVSNVNQLMKERDTYRNNASSEEEKILKLLPSENGLESPKQRPVIRAIKFGLMGGVIGLFVVFAILFLYCLSDNSVVLPFELREYYELDRIFLVGQNNSKNSLYPNLSPLDTKNYLSSLNRTYSEESFIYLGNVEEEEVFQLVENLAKQYYKFSSSLYGTRMDDLFQVENVILLESLNTLTHKMLKQQLSFVENAGKEIHAIFLL